MNRHTKIALFVAPFLIIGGYAAMDFYEEHQANKPKVINLTKQGNCDLMAKDCVLTADDFKLNVYQEEGKTMVNSTFALDTATLFVVNKDSSVRPYTMLMQDTRFYWRATTNLDQTIATPGSKQTLRVIVQIKGGSYISEFESITQG